MHVTVLCDASYCSDYKVAGYGFWIACGRKKIGGSGRMIKPVENNNTAEMMAIANTIWKGIHLNAIEADDSILVQADCTSAMNKLMGKQPCKTKQEQEVFDYFHETIKGLSLTIAFKHVKAHTGINDSRSIANQRCDRNARREMRLARIERINGVF